MDRLLLQKLKDWRNNVAENEGVEPFRVLPNKTIENIATTKPVTKEELLAIKGIKDKKFEKYGKDILALINENGKNIKPDSDAKTGNNDKKPYTVSVYLNLLNDKLREQKARIQGEISDLKFRENSLYFSLKDKIDESVLNCFMWRSDYGLCGISFEQGMEIIIEGFPEIWKPSGRLNLRVSLVELIGEGALKKAYDQLKKKLEEEGLFAPERKKPIPEFSQKIGLITSETGAVIHDFRKNLGKYGYQIKFFNSRVEGQAAVRDLLSALDYFGDKDIDVLVIIRGGGSLESLQAFNNETLVRKIADFKIPIVCGIGHDRDVPLASLAADLMVSTPSIVTVILNKSWESAINSVKYRLNSKLTTLDYILRNAKKKLDNSLNVFLGSFEKNLSWFKDYLIKVEKRLKSADPMRQLKLGYSIASIKGTVIRSVKQVKQGEEFDVQVSDGKIKSKVDDIINPSPFRDNPSPFKHSGFIS